MCEYLWSEWELVHEKQNNGRWGPGKDEQEAGAELDRLIIYFSILYGQKEPN